MSLILVMSLLAIGLALSYVLVRAQMTASILQNNDSRQANARQAALAGISTALREIASDNWKGVDTVVSGKLSSTESYWVTIKTGDESLTSSHPDWSQWPYRLTLYSTGSAQDPSDPNVAATYGIKVIVRLVPKTLPSDSSYWSDMHQYTVYQRTDGAFDLHFPGQIEGPTWMLGDLRVSHNYPSYQDARTQYLSDLGAMKANGVADYRPLNTNPRLIVANQQNTMLDRLKLMGLSYTDCDDDVDNDDIWSDPGEHKTYRLYPGGQQYQVPTVGSTLKNVTLQDDPKTNPLGLFYAGGDVSVESNVTLRGTLICGGDVRIKGTSVDLRAVDLPSLYGSSQPLRLPVIMAGDDVSIEPAARATIRGLVSAYEDFSAQSDGTAATVDLEGRVVCDSFQLQGATGWDKSSATWKQYYEDFEAQKSNGQRYFPLYLASKGLPPQPGIRIHPPADNPQYHWKQANDPLYTYSKIDAGLRWELVDWAENVSP